MVKKQKKTPKKINVNQLYNHIFKNKLNHNKLIHLKKIYSAYDKCFTYLQKYSEEELIKLEDSISNKKYDQNKIDLFLNIFLSKNIKEKKSKKLTIKNIKPNKKNKLHKCLSNYTYIKDLGSGVYGTTYLVEKNNQQFAIKEQLVYNNYISQNDSISNITNEIKIAINMGKQKIGPKIYDHYICKDKGLLKVYIVMEYMKLGTLSQWIKNNVFTNKHKKQIKNKIDKMHKGSNYHRDIHAENIFVTEEKGKPEFYIGDFGLSYSGMENIKDKLSKIDNKSFENMINFIVKDRLNSIISKLFFLWKFV